MKYLIVLAFAALAAAGIAWYVRLLFNGDEPK